MSVWSATKDLVRQVVLTPIEEYIPVKNLINVNTAERGLQPVLICITIE